MENFPIPAPVFRGESRSVDAGNAFAWLRHGWALFLAKPAQWLILALILMAIMLVLSVFPLIGALAANLLTPLFVAGMLQASRRAGEDAAPELADLFAGFRRQAGNLIVIGACYMLGLFLIFVIGFAVGGGGMVGGLMNANPVGLGVAMGSVMLAVLLTLLLSVPLIMAVWFAPALVFFNNMPPFEAMKASFNACMKNMPPFLIYGLIVLIFSFFAALPMFLGFLVFLPVLFGSIHAAYRDIFVAD